MPAEWCFETTVWQLGGQLCVPPDQRRRYPGQLRRVAAASSATSGRCGAAAGHAWALEARPAASRLQQHRRCPVLAAPRGSGLHMCASISWRMPTMLDSGRRSAYYPHPAASVSNMPPGAVCKKAHAGGVSRALPGSETCQQLTAVEAQRRSSHPGGLDPTGARRIVHETSFTVIKLPLCTSQCVDRDPGMAAALTGASHQN